MLEHALSLAARGLKVFPLRYGTKIPVHTGWQQSATTDPDKIRYLWEWDPVLESFFGYNVGVCLDDTYVIADLDLKKGQDGRGTCELLGIELPPTFTVRTATGGEHAYYRTPYAVMNGTKPIPGTDIKTAGGLVVGPGSIINDEAYTITLDAPVADAHPSFLERLKKRNGCRDPKVHGIDVQTVPSALPRATEYLKTAPVGVDGQRNDTAYRVACHLRDLGLGFTDTLGLMGIFWDCTPALEDEELEAVVQSAFKHAQNPPGLLAPEMQFTPVEKVPPPPPPKDWVDHWNDEFAFIVVSDKAAVIWFKKDEQGNDDYQIINTRTFHEMKANDFLYTEDKPVLRSKIWMSSVRRRSYDGFCFNPGNNINPRYFNLWKGFACEPLARVEDATPVQIDAVKKLIHHGIHHVCGGDRSLFRWIWGYMASMFQKPEEKPLTGVVFQGRKGGGKNAFVDRFLKMLGDHTMTASNKRYLVGNFNGHLERCLGLVLDETAWAGDKPSEGILKDLITGDHHLIERKGLEAYKVRNLTRVFILGNDRWLVPATDDERRFAVFEVKNPWENKKGVRKQFFESMRLGIDKHGGNRLLLRLLLDFDLSSVDLDIAPETEALQTQKTESLDGIGQWWLDSIVEGDICGLGIPGWPGKISTNSLMNAAKSYIQHTIGASWKHINADRFGRILHRLCPEIQCRQKIWSSTEKKLQNSYRLPSLEEARKSWELQYGFEGRSVDNGRTREEMEDDEQWAADLENLGKGTGIPEAGA